MRYKLVPQDPYSFQSIAANSANQALTAANYATTPPVNSISALITVETGSIRWRADGGVPTANEGHLAVANTTIELKGYPAVNKFRFILANGVSNSELMVSYLKD